MKWSWSPKDIPRLDGKIAVVTGANSGIGYHTAREIGRAGAEVIVACRDPGRAEKALASLRAEAPGAQFSLEMLDLADLTSVRAFAERLSGSKKAIDLLVNNAGIMAIPKRSLTAQGFELQFGTNHLGHFALTGLLLPLLLASGAPRVVTLSSFVAHFGRINLNDLQRERGYSPMSVYNASKLANLHFMLELNRRAAKAGLVSVGSHPGTTKTNLQVHAFSGIVGIFGQSAARGALPSLYAATAPDVAGGDYFGPRYFEMFGPPARAFLPFQSRNAETARALWDASEELTSVRYAIPGPP